MYINQTECFFNVNWNILNLIYTYRVNIFATSLGMIYIIYIMSKIIKNYFPSYHPTT